VTRDYSRYIKRPGYRLPPGFDPSNYPPQSATADIVIFAFFNRKLNVLLVRRKKMPFQGYWALPGGFVEREEDLAEAAARELREETGLKKLRLEEFGAFGHPLRDPRTRTITIAYLALVRREKIKPQAGDDAAELEWFPANQAPELAFDHELVLKKALQRLRELAVLKPALFELLPEKFSAEELAALCTEIFQKKFSPEVLAAKLKSAGLLKQAEGKRLVFNRRAFVSGSLGSVFAKRS